MSDLTENFLRREELAPGAAPRVYLGAFGKHPGWNDHIEDLELETSALLAAKQLIYNEGISRQIDAGAWDKLEAGSVFPGFDHLFLWQRGQEALVGLIVSSRDGKQRTRYPLVVCAHTVGLALPQIITGVVPAIEQAVAACRATESAAGVREILAATRRQLAEMQATAQTEPVLAAPAASEAMMAALGEGLYRILHEVKGKLPAWAPGRSNAREVDGHRRGAHLRVAQTWDIATAWPWWSALFTSQLEASVPLLFLWPRSERWLDVIVGLPEADDFFVLRAGIKAVPVANDVPYELDEAFRNEVRAVAAEFDRGEKSRRTIFGERPARTRASLAGGLAIGRETWRRVGGAGWGAALRRAWNRLGKIGRGLVLGIVVAVVAGVIMTLRWHPEAPAPAKPPAVEQAPQPTAAATALAPAPAGTAAAWSEFCHAYNDWFGSFAAAAGSPERRRLWLKDNFLKAQVIAPIEQARRKFGDLDPRKLAKTSGSLTSLADAVPDELKDETTRARVLEVAGLVRQTAVALAGWPALGQIKDLHELLAARGWRAVSRVPAGGLTLNQDLAENIDRTIEAAQELAPAVKAAPGLLADLDALEATTDPVLITAARHFREELKEAATPRAWLEAVATTRGAVDRVRPWLGAHPTAAMDWQRFHAEETTLAEEKYGASLLERWRTAAEQYRPLAPEEWPLTASAWRDTLADLRGQLGQLKTFAKNPVEAAALEGRIAALDARAGTYLQGAKVRKDLAAMRPMAREIVADAASMKAELASAIARSTDPTAWLEQTQRLAVKDSPAIEAEWVSIRAQLIGGGDVTTLKADPRRLLELQSRVERAWRFVSGLAATEELPRAAVLPAGTRDDVWMQLQALVPAKREAALGELFHASEWNDGEPRKALVDFLASPGATKVVAEYRQWLAELAEFGGATSALAAQLDANEGWSDQLATGYDAWRKQTAVPAEVVATGALGGVAGRLEGWAALARGSGLEQLIAVARKGKRAGERLTAWRRLGALPIGWPWNARELTVEQEISDGLKQAIEEQIAGARRTALLDEVARERARRWQVALAAAARNGDWDGVLARQAVMGVAAEQLEPASQFNVWLYRMRTKDWLRLAPGELQAEREAAVNFAQALGDRVPEARTLASHLAAISLTAPGPDFAHTGPGLAGWTWTDAGKPGVLRYTWKEHHIDFAVLDGGAGTYLATGEFPVGLFEEWVKAQGLRKAVEAAESDLLSEYNNALLEKRLGPVTFTKSANQDFEVGLKWMPKLGANYYEPNKMTPAKPGPESPVNYVGPRTAKLLAESLHCRLPTPDEWKAASKLVTAKAGEVNRRDRSWEKFKEFVAKAPGYDEQKPWPDGDIYPVKALTQGEAVAVSTEDDGELWFADVESGPGPFHHIVGNVAEIVGDGSKYFVMGASALSPPEELPETPYPDPESDTRGYSDVGFRLALSLQTSSPAQMVGQCFALQEYVAR